METFKAETAIPYKGKAISHEEAQGVDSKFRVTGPKRLVKANHKRLCVERVFKKLKRQLNLENHYKGLANVRIHTCLT
jgi:hypothetical protein